MTIDASAFDFATMKQEIGTDPFADTAKKYAQDDRFYKLAKDKDGNGAAVIRFLPDIEKGMIQQMYRINTTIVKNGKKRFVNEYSPSTIGEPCPFQEKWQSLWNANEKEASKQFGRSTRYVTNIKVIRDPANPDNEGKIFLFEMSGAMKTKIQNAVSPSEQDVALGAKAKELFNPLRGHSFRLIAKKGANGQINYDSSEVDSEVTSIYASGEEALTDIRENAYKLSDLLKPESFLSYEELTKKMEWVTFTESNQNTNQTTQNVTVGLNASVATPQVTTPEVKANVESTPVQTETSSASTEQSTSGGSLDDLLAGLASQ